MTESDLHNIIKESVNRILKEWGDYPMGAENDPRAPYNQPDEPDWDAMYGEEINSQIESEIDSQDENFMEFCDEKYGTQEIEDFTEYANNPEVRKAYYDFRYDMLMDEKISDYNWDDMDEDPYYDEDEYRYSRY